MNIEQGMMNVEVISLLQNSEFNIRYSIFVSRIPRSLAQTWHYKLNEDNGVRATQLTKKRVGGPCL
jgi:hypothetical protein